MNLLFYRVRVRFGRFRPWVPDEVRPESYPEYHRYYLLRDLNGKDHSLDYPSNSETADAIEVAAVRMWLRCKL